MVRTVDSFMGWREASAIRTSSAVAVLRPQTTSITRCSSSLRAFRFRELNIVALQYVARIAEDVKRNFGNTLVAHFHEAFLESRVDFGARRRLFRAGHRFRS